MILLTLLTIAWLLVYLLLYHWRWQPRFHVWRYGDDD